MPGWPVLAFLWLGRCIAASLPKLLLPSGRANLLAPITLVILSEEVGVATDKSKDPDGS